MPNWCENTITVTGNKAALDRFINIAGSGTGLCSSLCPAPSHEQMRREIGSQKDILTEFPVILETFDLDKDAERLWRMFYWGCKWDVPYPDADVNCGKKGDSMWSANFMTANSPVLPLMKRVSISHPQLTFSIQYAEYNMNFAGFASYNRGEEIVVIEGHPGLRAVYSGNEFVFPWCEDFVTQMAEEEEGVSVFKAPKSLPSISITAELNEDRIFKRLGH